MTNERNTDSTWTPEEVDSISGTDEIHVAGSREDGSLRSSRVIWIVAVDGELYIRSVNGPDADWYAGVRHQMTGAITWSGNERNVAFVDDASRDDEVDEAYRRKYGNGSPTQALNREPARGTTLRVDAK